MKQATTTQSDHDLILGSASPRRQELLAQLGVNFHVHASDIDETPFQQESPAAYVARLAEAKSSAVMAEVGGDIPVLGSDTIVVSQSELFGKPVDEADATRMLTALSGREHQVMTAVCVRNRERHEVVVVVSDVTFRELTEAEISAYWQSGEPEGKAGAYAIQGLGATFVSAMKGSYSGIVGLPLYQTDQLLKSFAVPTRLRPR